jgi:hypothetical protein
MGGSAFAFWINVDPRHVAVMEQVIKFLTKILNLFMACILKVIKPKLTRRD